MAIEAVGSGAPPVNVSPTIPIGPAEGTPVTDAVRARIRELEQQGRVVPPQVQQQWYNQAQSVDTGNIDPRAATVNAGPSGVSPPSQNTDRGGSQAAQGAHVPQLTPEQQQVVKAINEAPNDEMRGQIMSAFGVTRGADGGLVFPPGEPTVNVRNLYPGMSAEQAGVTQSASETVDRGRPWMVASAVASGLGFNNLGTMIGSTVLGGAISTMRHMPNPNSAGGYAMATAGWSGIETMAQAGDYPGLAHGARMIMHSYAREQRIDSMIRIIDSGAYAIEDLIFLFMAHIQELMEERLRDKMREQQIAEKLEERRDRIVKMAELEAGMVRAQGSSAQGLAGSLGSIVGMFVPAAGAIINGAGSVAKGVADARANQIEMNAQRQIEQQANMNGNMKSATALAAEVQMIMHKWKQYQEMMSNLLKSMHDMAMTPIRNLR